MNCYRFILLIAVILLNSTSNLAQNNLTFNFYVEPCQKNFDDMKISCENLMTNKIFTVKGKKSSELIDNVLRRKMTYEIYLLKESKYRIRISQEGCGERTLYLDTKMPVSTYATNAFYYNFKLNPIGDPLDSKNFNLYHIRSYVDSTGNSERKSTAKLIAEMLFNIAVEKSLKNEYEAAIIDYTEALKFVPNDINSLYNRGVIKGKLGDSAGACEDWNIIKSNGFHDADALLQKYCN